MEYSSWNSISTEKYDFDYANFLKNHGDPFKMKQFLCKLRFGEYDTTWYRKYMEIR